MNCHWDALSSERSKIDKNLLFKNEQSGSDVPYVSIQGVQSSKWEYQKNSTILELEARNRALQERLAKVAEVPKSSPEKPGAERHPRELVDLEGLLASIKAPHAVKEGVTLNKGGNEIRVSAKRMAAPLLKAVRLLSFVDFMGTSTLNSVKFSV